MLLTLTLNQLWWIVIDGSNLSWLPKNYTSGSVVQLTQLSVLTMLKWVLHLMLMTHCQFHIKNMITLQKRGSEGDVTQAADGIQAAYTMGGATLRISDVSVITVVLLVTQKTELKLVC